MARAITFSEMRMSTQTLPGPEVLMTDELGHATLDLHEGNFPDSGVVPFSGICKTPIATRKAPPRLDLKSSVC